jgi:hypothetical protein
MKEVKNRKFVSPCQVVRNKEHLNPIGIITLLNIKAIKNEKKPPE